MSREIFAGLLRQLHTDADTAAREYARLREKLLGYFDLRGDHDPDTAADATLDRAAAKLAAGVEAPNVGRYCLGIARMVALERQREAQRERAAFQHFHEERAARLDEQTEAALRLMADCLEKLSDADRELLAAYCRRAPGEKHARRRTALAAAQQMAPATLRLRVHRLRQKLHDCVKKSAAR
jgi:hypothetical protein